MSDSKKELWISWLSLSTAIIAVLAAITTLYMGKYSSRAIMKQGLESNQWAYYQAKSIKQHTYELQKKTLELQFSADRSRMSGDSAAAFRETIDAYEQEVKRYEGEKKEIKTKAEKIEKEKLIAQEMGGNFGYALIFVQISIMLSSIASLTKKHYLWYLSLLCVVGWGFFFLDAIYLFY